MAIDLQILHPLIDNQLTYEPQGLKIPSSPKAIIPAQVHHPTSVEISTTEESVHDHIVPSATCVSDAQVHTQSSFAPTHQGSPLSTLDIKNPRTPVRPLILECELHDHPDKAFVEQLLSDIRQGCNIGYTGPQLHTQHAVFNLPTPSHQS